MKIIIEKIKPIDKGNLKAFVDIKLGDSIVINGCRIVQQPGQKAWVSMPQNEVEGKYYPVVKILNKTIKEEIEKAILNEWGKIA